jgi:aspartyl-tRNA(Asn)/glutamyl-tRNA(Gln) amidotransferase subunit A
VREAGCTVLGKTTMPDYGMLSSGLSSLHGVTRNPWRTDRNTSGSSSGAAAAAVAGYAPLHVGTDIGGSVRLPATHCGIFALKPSLGRVPVHPPYMGRVAGPMTRSVEDAALLMNVLARPDARDFMSLPHEKLDLTQELDALSPKGLKIGFLADMGVGLAVHSEVRAAAQAAAGALAGAGCIVEPIGSFLTRDMLDGMCRFFEARSYHDFMQLPAQRRERVLPFVAEWCSWRAQGFTGRDVMHAYASVMAMREAAVCASAGFDFLLSPTSPILPYEAELAAPGNDPRNALPHIAFTVPYNMSEQPAASVNWTASREGLPIGIQLIGRRFDDRGVLRLSRLVELLRPEQRAWPD